MNEYICITRDYMTETLGPVAKRFPSQHEADDYAKDQAENAFMRASKDYDPDALHTETDVSAPAGSEQIYELFYTSEEDEQLLFSAEIMPVV